MKKRTPTGDLAVQVMAALDQVRQPFAMGSTERTEAVATLETFCSMALELISITNPSTVRKVATNMELRRLIPPSSTK